MHVDESVTTIAQAMRRIPFSGKQKVVDKLEELEALDVIEKVNGPTSWINPLVAVEKPNGGAHMSGHEASQSSYTKREAPYAYY